MPNISTIDLKDEKSLREDLWTPVKPLRKARRYSLRSIWRPHNRKIIMTCGLVSLPMIVFTLTILGLVFSYLVKQQSDCAYPDLCPGPYFLDPGATRNITSKSNYYVEYPASRLAFLASLSSTVSFSLVGILMTLYAYSVSCDLLEISKARDQHDKLPTPYQTSLLMRVVNAELLSLWDLATTAVVRRRKIWVPPALRTPVVVFLSCLVSSLLIQAADTYLHISITAVNIVQTYAQSVDTYPYSRGLAPWCANRKTVGSRANPKFWGCSINYRPDMDIYNLANTSLMNEYSVGLSQDFSMDYTDKIGLQIAIVGPPRADVDVDWKASTFGVSTKCSAIPFAACDVWNPEVSTWSFNCTKERGGIDLSGNMSTGVQQWWFPDFHKYLNHSRPFVDMDVIPNDPDDIEAVEILATKVTDDEEVFRNPFKSLQIVSVLADHENQPEQFRNDPRLWLDTQMNYFMLQCTTTVWDVTYISIDRKIAEISRTPANSTMTGAAIMPALSDALFSPDIYKPIQTAGLNLVSVDAFINTYSLAFSKLTTVALAAQTTARPAFLAQKRVPKLVTQLPIAALWSLVIANTIFALLGIGLSVAALLATNESVYQVYTRLGIAGLVAERFEKPYSESAVSCEAQLFEEDQSEANDNGGIIREKGSESGKRVGVEITEAGGSVFLLSGRIPS